MLWNAVVIAMGKVGAHARAQVMLASVGGGTVQVLRYLSRCSCLQSTSQVHLMFIDAFCFVCLVHGGPLECSCVGKNVDTRRARKPRCSFDTLPLQPAGRRMTKNRHGDVPVDPDAGQHWWWEKLLTRAGSFKQNLCRATWFGHMGGPRPDSFNLETPLMEARIEGSKKDDLPNLQD